MINDRLIAGACESFGSDLPAEVTVNARAIDEEISVDVPRQLEFCERHAHSV